MYTKLGKLLDAHGQKVGLIILDINFLNTLRSLRERWSKVYIILLRPPIEMEELEKMVTELAL